MIRKNILGDAYWADYLGEARPSEGKVDPLAPVVIGDETPQALGGDIGFRMIRGVR